MRGLSSPLFFKGNVMPYKMINKTVGINDPMGVTTRVYNIDEIIEEDEEWKKKVGENFMKCGHAMYVDAEVVVPMTKSNHDDLPSDVEPKEEKPKKKKKKSFFNRKK